MRIDSFKIEEWMNTFCPSAQYDLTSTCIKPMSIRELIQVCRLSDSIGIFDKSLDYGEIHGSDRLKKAIMSIYTNQKTDNITVTHGAIGANQLVFESLLEKGDEVLCFLPIYQQHYSVPKSLGAKVNFLYLREENNWLPNLNELEKTLNGRTKLICINSPNNPTGSVIPDDMLTRIAEIAKKNNSWILSDEVYRGLNFEGNSYSRSMADIYEKGISVGSMSKTYSLPGLRVGWVVGRGNLINEINHQRQYNTISVSILDDYFASVAIENREAIAERNFNIMKNGLEILKKWLSGNLNIDCVLPTGGTTVLIKYNLDIPSRTFCKELQKTTGVALLPGETLEMEGYARLGFCAENLEPALDKISEYIKSLKQ